MPTYTPATEEMRDVLREGRFHTSPGVNHVLAMDLLAQEASLDVWVSGWDGVRSARDIARDALDEMRRRALVRSYGPRPLALRVLEERVVQDREAA